jgi:BTB/POZ domain
MVQVFVGEQRKLYVFHKGLLTSRCPYFEKCLAPSFPEGRNNEVVLEEENCEEFDYFFDWIYTEQVEVTDKIPIAALYVLANRFCMEGFEKSIVNALPKYFRYHEAPIEQLAPLVNHNLYESPLAIALMERIAYELDHQQRDIASKSSTALFDVLGPGEAWTTFFEILEEEIYRKAMDMHSKFESDSRFIEEFADQL